MSRAQRGFTLLEVLVATAILAIAISGVLSALSTSMRNAARLTDYDRAAMLARRKMEELLIDDKLPPRMLLQGQFDPRHGWRARIDPWEYATPEPPGPGAEVVERVVLEIWWNDGDRHRTYNVEAFRRGVVRPQ